MAFGGKVFVIGVGKAEQNVSCPFPKSVGNFQLILNNDLQIPFMICSANEIDIQFQYRYCHQVRQPQ
jgi:hypothetical protein